MRTLAWIVVGLCLLPDTAGAQPVTNDEILRNFALLAFEQPLAADRPGTIIKWNSAIRIWVRSDAEPKRHRELRSMVEAQAEQLSFITGLDMEVIDHGSSNFVVIFAADIYAEAAGRYFDTARQFFPDDRTMAQHLATHRQKRTYCVVYFLKDAETKPAGALVLIPYSPDPRPTLGCVAEKMTQALGFLHESREHLRVSLFSEGARKHRYVALTSHDILLLGILYDPRIRHGMSRAETMPIARDILQQLRPPREPAAQEQRPILPRRGPTDRPI